jgi:hypothetical protein
MGTTFQGPIRFGARKANRALSLFPGHRLRHEGRQSYFRGRACFRPARLRYATYVPRRKCIYRKHLAFGMLSASRAYCHISCILQIGVQARIGFANCKLIVHFARRGQIANEACRSQWYCNLPFVLHYANQGMVPRPRHPETRTRARENDTSTNRA